MYRRPVILLTAAALVGGVTLPGALASEEAGHPARGVASSVLTLVELRAAGHEISVGSAKLSSTNLDGVGRSAITITPLRGDGVAVGEQEIGASDGAVTVPGASTSALPGVLADVASLTSPSVSAEVVDGDVTSSKVGTGSLGSLSILGIPVSLEGSVEAGSLVSNSVSSGTKTLTVEEVALPSVADLLAALGLDVSKLPVATLTQLVNELDLTNQAVTEAQAALDGAQAEINAQLEDAQAAVDAQQAVVDEKVRELAAAEVVLTESQARLRDAQTTSEQAGITLDAARAEASATQQAVEGATSAITSSLPLGISTLEAYLSSPLADPALVAAYEAATAADTAAGAAVASAQAAADAAADAVTGAENAVAAAQRVVDAAQDALEAARVLLNELLDAVQDVVTSIQAEIDALVASVVALLDETPLVEVESFTVSTIAKASSAAEGGQEASVVGGELQGVHVLGTDVLSNVLGSSSVELTELSAPELDLVNEKIASLTGVLESVLSEVPGLTVPAPEVGVLTKHSETSIVDGFGVASNTVQALSITLPSITVPAELAAAGAASLPAVSGPVRDVLPGAVRSLAVGDIVSQEISVVLGKLGETARFQPGVMTTAPGTEVPPVSAPVGENPTTEVVETPVTEVPTTEVPTAQTPTTTAAPRLPRTGGSEQAVALGMLLLGAALVLRRRYSL